MNPHAARVLDTVDQLLLEIGQEDAADLRVALLSLGDLAAMPVPAPGPRLAELLAGTPVHTTRREAMAREAAVSAAVARQGARFRSEELARRRAMRRNRSAVVGLTVVAGMGLGVTSVAASLPETTDNNATVQQLLQDWTPRWTIGAPRTPVVDATPAPTTGNPGPGTANTAVEPDDAPVTAPGQGPGATGKPQGAENTEAAPGAGKPGQSTGADSKASRPGKAQEDQDPPEETLEDALAAKPGNSGAGQKASPGARWLKKFSQ